MAIRLDGKKVAILAAEGVEQVEMVFPKEALHQVGAQTQVVSLSPKFKAWNFKDWGDVFEADALLESADANQYDALLIPGGVMSPDQLRMQPKAVEFVSQFFDSGKPIASICHGPWMLVEADVVRGKIMTSWPSLKTDIRNAGGRWVDQEVVRDDRLVTSRMPDDIPVFNEKMIALFSEGAYTVAEMAA
jgi:protease I